MSGYILWSMQFYLFHCKHFLTTNLQCVFASMEGHIISKIPLLVMVFFFNVTYKQYLSLKTTLKRMSHILLLTQTTEYVFFNKFQMF